MALSVLPLLTGGGAFGARTFGKVGAGSQHSSSNGRRGREV